MLPILVFLLCFPSLVISATTFQKLDLPSTAVGPESSAFDLLGQGPYTGISDGRIIKFQRINGGFTDFAFTTPTRTKAMCDGTSDPNLGATCGRPLGLGFYKVKNQLFIADAYIGLLVVGSNGRLATKITSSADGVPIKFLNALDVDQLTGNVYFTDASSVYNLSQIAQIISTGDATGRLLKYDPKTQQITVLQKGLASPAGAAVSLDGSFVLVSELTANRIQKFWLRGPKAFTSEILVNFEGRPNNIKTTTAGYFWVAVNMVKPGTQINVPTAIKINALGNILETVPLDAQYNNVTISEVQEFRATRFVGSLRASFLGVYT